MTAQYYVSRLLSHISERDILIKAWVFLDGEAAMKQAKALDDLKPERRGPLHGIPIGVKDIVAVQGRTFTPWRLVKNIHS